MSRLTRKDRILLAAFLPLFAVAFALHVREVVRTGLMQPPIYAAPSADGSGFPRVGGFRIERERSDQGLRIGDRLIRIGGTSLRHQGYFGFDAHALAEAGERREAPLVYERDGVRRTTRLRMPSPTLPWFRIPFALSFVLIATLVLVRAPGRRQSRAFFAAFVAFAILEVPFFGGPPAQTYAALALFNFGGAIAVFLALRFTVVFPSEVPEDARAPAWLPWLAGLYVLVRLDYLFGGPFPTPWVPYLTLASDGLFAAVGLGILTWNHAHATPVGRRRLRWVMLGGYLAVLPVLAATLVTALAPEASVPFHHLVEISGLAAVALPLGILISIVRSNLFDIDRLVSAAAWYSLVGAAMLVAALLVIPRVASTVGAATGLPLPTTQVALVALLAVGLLATQRRLRPVLDRTLFPERARREEGIGQILRDLSACESVDDVLDLASRGVATVQGAAFSALYVRRGDALQRTGPGPVPTLPASGALVRSLERRPVPLHLDGSAPEAAVPELSGHERSALQTLGAAVLLPIRRGAQLHALAALGPRRSGDEYTRTDRTLLAAVGEAASAALQRVRHAEMARLERDRADELETLRARAEAAHRQRSRFLAAASHDLRQPLHALGVYAQLLEERLGPHEAQALVARIRSSSASLGEMFTSLLDVSRLDVGAVEPRTGPVELDPLFDELAAELAQAAAAKRLELRVERSGLVVESDRILLGRILRNLLVNAVRYTGSGRVGLCARASEAHVAIDVVDTGPGIPPELREAVFTEFVRLGDDDEAAGLGLGLAIARRLARLLGHPLELASEPGRGSRFTVRAAPGKGALASTPEPATSLGFDGRLVMVVDDDREILRVTRELLRGWGCRVLAASCLEEALESMDLRGVPPDAVLADYRLRHGETGLEVIDAVRRRSGAAIPAAILTGETAPRVLDAIEAVGLPVLAKPVAPAKMRALLAELLRGAASDPLRGGG